MAVRRAGRRLVVSALALILVISTAGVSAPPSVNAAFPGAAGRIAWQKTDETGSHIWTMHADGSDKVDLGVGMHPSWSPDGSRLLVSSASGIEVMDADGGNRSVVLDHGSWPVWSPNGAKIAFACLDAGASDWDIYSMDANGTNVVNLTNVPTEDVEPAWSPDGSHIAYRGNGGVWVMDADGSNPTDLTPGAPGGAPDWSPDGSTIAYDDKGIWTMAANGMDKVKIVVGGNEPAWSPDGGHLVFTSGGLEAELFVVAANGSNPTRLTYEDDTRGAPPKDQFPTWQPSAFAFSVGALAFGNAAIGLPTSAKTITFRAGIDPVTVTSVALGGPNADQFQTTSDTCSGVVVASMGACTVAVRFAATTAGVKDATLTLSGPAPLGTSSVPLHGAGSFTWGTRHLAGPSTTSNDGRSLATTKTTTKTYLHGVYTRYRAGGHAGAYYIRSSNRGTTWTTPKRLNPSTQHGSHVSIASSGKYVYTSWISTTRWVNFRPGAPRVLYFRRNTSHGSSTAWSSTIRLTSTTGRVNAPTIAASGAHVYVTWIDANTGKVRVAISPDHGKTWRKTSIGSVTGFNAGMVSNAPRIATSGTGVAVVWISSDANVAKIRTATGYGATWDPTIVLGPTLSQPDVAMKSDRVAVAWTWGRAVQLRVRTNGSWGPTTPLPASDGYAKEFQYDPAIALYGTDQVGIVYSACIEGCGDDFDWIHSDLIWRQSWDNAATWGPSDRVASSSASNKRRNDAASVVWKLERRPVVLWNGWTEETTSFRLSVRGGT